MNDDFGRCDFVSRRFVLSGLAGAFAMTAVRADAETYTPGQGVEILQLTRPGNGSVNSYVLVGPDSVAIIDCQRTLVEARALAQMVAGIGKPVQAIVLTHEHPDHTMGLAAVAGAFPDAPILASALTQDTIAKTGAQTAAFMKTIFPGAIPDGIPAPTRLIAGGERIELVGAEWVVDQRGPCEALGMTLLHAPDQGILVAADLFGNHVTPYLAEGHTGDWLAEIAAARSAYAGVDRALPGHGSAGPLVPLVDAQAAYLSDIRALVQAQLAAGPLTGTGREAVRRAMDARYPGFPTVAPGDLMATNIDAVAKELTA